MMKRAAIYRHAGHDSHINGCSSLYCGSLFVRLKNGRTDISRVRNILVGEASTNAKWINKSKGIEALPLDHKNLWK
jgi:hypothetical protein